MQAAKWITEAQRAGWRVQSSQAGYLRLCCAREGCPGEVMVPLASLGATPDPCKLPHVGRYGAAAYELYTNFVDDLRRRRRQLGLSQEDVNSAAGLTDGHMNKLEAFHRTAQFPTLQLWAATLGLEITMTPTPLPAATTRAIEARMSNPYSEGRATSSRPLRKEA